MTEPVSKTLKFLNEQLIDLKNFEEHLKIEKIKTEVRKQTLAEVKKNIILNFEEEFNDDKTSV